jgi:collagenase-like PrtC family protease
MSHIKEFRVAGFYEHFGLYRFLLSQKDWKKFLQDGRQIESVYGSLPGFVWAGGRNNDYGGALNLNFLEKAVEMYNSHGIGVYLTATNVFADQEMFGDYYCNQVMKIFNSNAINGVITLNNSLEDYLRNSYSNLRFVLSVVWWFMNQKDISHYSELDTPKYFKIVLRSEDSRDFSLIKKNISKKEWPRIEIFVNEKCNPECPLRIAHNEIISRANMYQAKPHEGNEFLERRKKYNCPRTKDTKFSDLPRELYLNNQDIETFTELGINKFKMEGRDALLVHYIQEFADYLLKEKYREDFVHDTIAFLKSRQK